MNAIHVCIFGKHIWHTNTSARPNRSCQNKALWDSVSILVADQYKTLPHDHGGQADKKDAATLSHTDSTVPDLRLEFMRFVPRKE